MDTRSPKSLQDLLDMAFGYDPRVIGRCGSREHLSPVGWELKGCGKPVYRPIAWHAEAYSTPRNPWHRKCHVKALREATVRKKQK
jgi:hypothetical protein